MEQRLIDANELLDTTEHLAQVCFGQGQCYCERTKFQQLIKKQPTVDAVRVVRCGECIHWDEKPLIKNEKGMTRFGVCRLWHDGYLKADFYCAGGERRTNEQTD